MKKIYQIAIVILILLLLFLFKGFFKETLITSLGGYTKKETDTIVQTRYKIGKIDTLEIFNSYIETKGIKIGETKIITNYVNTTTNKTIKDSLKVHNIKIEDSLLSGNFTIYNKLNGDLEDSYFNYKPKFPKLIRRVDTLTQTITITETLSKEKNLIGGGLGITHINTEIYGSVVASFQLKNNLQFLVEIGKPVVVQNTDRNNNLFSLKVIKQF